MKIEPAKREQSRIRLALSGASGTGKTIGSLQIAYGLTGDWRKICVIDTEHNSACLYSHLGPFNTLCLKPPFQPEKFIQAIKLAEAERMEVIVIDSSSHLWDGPGGILDIHGSMTGNSFTNWSKVTPLFNDFVQAMLQSSSHIISTMRCKSDYILVEKNNRQIPEKVGLKPIQRDGIDYEYTICFDIDFKHNVIASKDRTGLFADRPPFKLSPSIGTQIKEWCRQGQAVNDNSVMINKINNARSVQELLTLYKENPSHQVLLLSYFSDRRKELESTQPSKGMINLNKLSANGSYNHPSLN
jgi:hypothetical protein